MRGTERECERMKGNERERKGMRGPERECERRKGNERE